MHSTDSRLLNLPTEVRAIICGHLFQDASANLASSYPSIVAEVNYETAILLTCRQIYEEAVLILAHFMELHVLLQSTIDKIHDDSRQRYFPHIRMVTTYQMLTDLKPFPALECLKVIRKTCICAMIDTPEKRRQFLQGEMNGELVQRGRDHCLEHKIPPITDAYNDAAREYKIQLTLVAVPVTANGDVDWTTPYWEFIFDLDTLEIVSQEALGDDFTSVSDENEDGDDEESESGETDSGSDEEESESEDGEGESDQGSSVEAGDESQA